MDYTLIVGDIIEALEDLSTTHRQEMSKHSFPSSQRVIGVTNPDMKEVIKAVRDHYTVGVYGVLWGRGVEGSSHR